MDLDRHGSPWIVGGNECAGNRWRLISINGQSTIYELAQRNERRIGDNLMGPKWVEQLLERALGKLCINDAVDHSARSQKL